MGKRKKSRSNSRYTNFNSGSSNSSFGWWLSLWVVWLVFFIILLPQIMCNGASGVDYGCANVPTSNLLYLWWFVLTFGTVMPYLDTVFGIWALLLIIGCWEMS